MSFETVDEFLRQQNKDIEVLYKPVLFNHWGSATIGDKECNWRKCKSYLFH